MRSKFRVFIIKLGGSIITDKDSPYTVKKNTIYKLAKVIKAAYNPQEQHLLLGHGAGSFAHIDANNYKTIRGIVDHRSIYGAAKVKYVALKLHQIVVEEFLRVGLPVFSFSPASFFLSSGFKSKELFLSPLLYALKFSLIPFFYGDVIIDCRRGFTIFSTEKIITMIVKSLKAYGLKNIVLIYLGNTKGVLDNRGKTIKKLSFKDFATVKKHVGGSSGYDVTGGMQHKVDEALKLSKLGISTVIADGNEFSKEFFIRPLSQPNTTVICS